MAMDVEILHLRPCHVSLLSSLFARISADPATSKFHPHPFTAEVAEYICGATGLDRYVALSVNENLRAYGMLRGWDAGFSIPSLGIYVEPELRGTGAARHLMQHLHLIARLSGADQIRLKVYRDNVAAYRLYKSLGYRFLYDVEGDAQLVGLCDL